MPYERKGKCIYNKETGEKKGCSSTVGKAKAHMRALYAAEKGTIKEESSKLTQSILDRAEDIYQAMTSNPRTVENAIKKYGSDAENVLRGRAINTAKKQVKMKNTDRLKEIIRKQLTVDEKKAKPDFLDLDKDGDKEESMKKAAQDAKTSVKEELDYEGEMAKSELYRLMQNAQELMSSLDDDTQLEAWVQSKITKAADYLNSVTQYLAYQNTKQGPTDERLDYTIQK
jgi:hypothetical protein